MMMMMQMNQTKMIRESPEEKKKNVNKMLENYLDCLSEYRVNNIKHAK